MLTTLLTIALTIGVCVALSRRYTIVTLKCKQATRVKDGWLRDDRSGLKIVTIHYDGCEFEIRLSSGAFDLASTAPVAPYYLSGLLNAVSLPVRGHRRSRYLMRRWRYNNLLQYASGRKKLPEQAMACC